MRILVCLALVVTGILIYAFRKVERTPYPFPELPFFPKMPLNKDNPVSVEGAELGRYLFYDPILSANGKVSCSSCHKQEFAFSDGGKKFSTGINGNKLDRNTPPIFNLAWKKELFWDGRAVGIEDQIFFPVRGHEEMGLDWKIAEERINKSAFYKERFNNYFPDQKVDSILISKVIAQFERTLISADSKYDKVLREEAYFTKDERQGLILMNDMTKGDCIHCHPTDGSPIMAALGFSNNGLDDYENSSDFPDKGRARVTGKEGDVGRFKIPSLRNLAVTGPYMHDGRFFELEEVLNFYSNDLHPSLNYDSRLSESIHRGGVRLNEEEQKQVIAFLNALTDSTFITNSEFSMPEDLPTYKIE